MIFPFITTYWGSFFSNSKVLGSIALYDNIGILLLGY